MVFRWIQDQFPEASGQTAQPTGGAGIGETASRVDRIFVTVPTAPGIATASRSGVRGQTLLRHIPALRIVFDA